MKIVINYQTLIPENEIINENGYMSINDVALLLIKYKTNPEKIQFIAEMLEE